MTHTIENGVLTLYLEGELNSYNSEEVEKDIDAILEKKGFSSIVVDFEHLSYISSAGLRIMAGLKKRYADTKLVRVPKGVYDIFEMVGFQNILTIEKL